MLLSHRMEEEMKDVLSFGEPLVGFYPTHGSSITDDGPVIKTWGGDTSNFALGIARLGHSVSYLTKVGNDPFGTAFIRLWQANGVDTSFVTIDQKRRTGLYFVSFENGVHKLTYYRSNSAASSITVDCVQADLLHNYRIVHLSGISIGMSSTALETGIHLVKLANKGNTKVSFDVNYRAAQWESVQSAEGAIVQIIDNGVDILEITDDEMAALGWGNSISDLADRFPRCETIIRKEGSNGATVYSKGEKYHFPAIPVKVKDTVGAGDSFDAGFIVALLEGKSIQTAGKFATAAAALTCTGTGPLERMPTKEQVNALLATL